LLEAVRLRRNATFFNLIGPIASNPWTRVYRGHSDAYPSPVAVKLHWDPDIGEPSREAAQETLTALQRAAQSARGDAKCFSSAPVDFFQDLAIVISEWVEGDRLDRLISGASPHELSSAFRAAGTWLAHLHFANARPPRPLDVDRALFGLSEAPDSALSTALRGSLKGAIDLLRRTAKLVASQDVAWALVHGDFKPSNLFRCGERTVGVDAQLIYEDAALFDAAHFLNHVALRLAWRPWRSAMERTKIIEMAFVEGYQQHFGLELPRRELLWARLTNALRVKFWHRARSRNPTSVFTAWALGRLIRELSAALERSMASNPAISEPAGCRAPSP
jgi:Ser/Thr protein kinase RdoA (MazF antagonist)